jgi:hypothetical protein
MFAAVHESGYVQLFGRRHLCLAGHVHIRSPLDNSGSIESPSTVIIILSSLGGCSETRGRTIASGNSQVTPPGRSFPG